jgi:preprotein translocase subunit SecF
MIDFLRVRAYTATASALLFAGFLGTMVYRYQQRGQFFSYSIDFTGGTQALMKFSKPVDVCRVKDVVENSGWQGACVREFGTQEVLVRVKEFVNDSKGLAERIRAVLMQEMPGYEISIEQSDAVGSGVGETLRVKSFYAVLIALLAMLVYIAFTFWSWAYATGAVVALFHDASIILFMFALFDFEISINVIGAILAVLGYSINDTIVIFSQIRENVATMGGSSLYDVVNVSLNQTLRRTILTSLSTAIPVLIMYLFGGEALKDFSFALLLGIIFGTYSSIYIASPIMMLLNPKSR